MTYSQLKNKIHFTRERVITFIINAIFAVALFNIFGILGIALSQFDSDALLISLFIGGAVYMKLRGTFL